MAREGCNLDNEEAEIIKTPSSSSPPRHHPPPPAASSSFPFPHQSSSPPSASPSPSAVAGESEPSLPRGNRCLSCRKRVGLAGFRCRCGELFCARHRYSSTHDCSFDYKAAGRAEICKANPVIRAAKIIKI
ncbi:Zinc finger AN1 domain-containing stress-associated protein 15 [Apostasia shenzhenica]|uniref:Zinc finger AN1 domain-containing stress-associated protein 15 n=1 Tax=Apostasia shenzhenica TaxID=1088818 RepID=A0A2I0AGU6_9ASPA|nr:Zinc finger AN1 domain-containing stress-associated protein 15 [Apostasia shenzhenica]